MYRSRTMKAELNGSTQRSNATAATVKTTQADSASKIARRMRVLNLRDAEPGAKGYFDERVTLLMMTGSFGTSS